MHEKSLQTLEFDKVVARVAQEAGFSIARERALALRPTADLDQARDRLAFTTEAVRLLDGQPWAGVGGAHDLRTPVARAARGGDLGPTELVALLSTLRGATTASRMLNALEPGPFPRMRGLGDRLPVHPDLVRRIEQVVNDEGEVLDSASARLRRLRNDVRAASQRLQQRLRSLVTELGHVLQEPIVTTRGERWVVPVKADFRGRVRGIVHDQSASGATVFIEPLVIVELSNQLRLLQAQEREEVERVLRELSAEVGGQAAGIAEALECLAELDLQLAKARYARLVRGTEPVLNDSGRVLLRRARHPLLSGHVVPVDFRLGGEFFVVVVTGPNTGGKTVALKTVGLLTLMAQAGLHVPADDGSEVAVFQEVFADIGDEQSIEQSLSTFSSHMTRIIEVLRSVEAARRRPEPEGPQRMLVLFDELGAGTDPDEGSALARSILTYLLDRGVPTVATTHYSELKAFAHEAAGAVNASVAFDLDTLSPTYELEIGLPGRSNALAIAQRLGLDPRIVRGARRHLGTAGVRMEGLLRDLEQERDAAAGERQQLGRELAEADARRRELDEQRRQLEQERLRVLDEARTQARRELDAVLGELAQIRATARSRELTPAGLDQARRRARRLEERVVPVSGSLPGRHPVLPEAERLAGAPEVGDPVRVLSLDRTGELVGLSADGSDAEVQLGAVRMRTGVEDLERVRRREPVEDAEPGPVRLRSEPRPAPAHQLDMRGWRVEDALGELETYLNEAVVSGLPSVRLLHGKGTGALRAAVREHLAGHPLVLSSAAAPAAEGGDGVTIVKLSA